MAHERYDKLHIFICMIVAVVIITVCLIRQESLFIMAMWTSIAIVFFWFLGNLVRYYIITRIFPPPEIEEINYDELLMDDMLEELPEEVMADAPANVPASPRSHDYMSSE
ncbi:MAG: hypothetical protein FWB88_04735 [Defluviitaleaceae bacterium]|nr:hypothetical protein [Defluviitaleaceae bacterium]MCL2238665.1 hypothetical protein [Defluviitaleaceae bacterium]